MAFETANALETTKRADAMTATGIGSVSIGAASVALFGSGLSDTVGLGSLMAVVLVVRSVTLRLDSVVVGSLPGLSGNDSTSEKNSLEHCKVKFSRLYLCVKMSPFKWFCLTDSS